MRLLGGDIDLVLHAGQSAQLSLHHHAMVVGVFNNLLGDLNILGKGLGGGVDHDGGKTAVNATLAGLKTIAMVQMEDNRNLRTLNDSSLYQLHQIGVIGIGPGAFGHLKNHGSLFFFAGLGDTLNDLHIVDVKRTYGVASIVGFFEHFGRGNQWHNCPTPYQNKILGGFRYDFNILHIKMQVLAPVFAGQKLQNQEKFCTQVSTK